MTNLPADAWINTESGFNSIDQTRLFYRSWQPKIVRTDGVTRALIFLHRGHEHSGRIQSLVEQFGFQQDWAFAWDARGHGYSPGARGDAPSFDVLVQDFNAFVAHIQKIYQIEPENIVIVANSVGAVIASTWIHDFAPRIRGVVMAAAAFKIKLYVPFAKSCLRLAICFKPDLFVTSYIRSSMLTHSQEQAEAYDRDTLVTKSISARVLLGLSDTAKRIVDDAAAIDVPILMLVADKDYVVEQAPQRQFFERISSPLKRYLVLENCFHSIFYEQNAQYAIDASRQFIDDCFACAPAQLGQYHSADTHSASAKQYVKLRQGVSENFVTNIYYGLQRAMLRFVGPLSDGMKIGLEHGFDSGASLDYVYRNQESGKLFIGKLIDRGYLDAIGWRGIRQRKLHLQQILSGLIAQSPTDQNLRILDIAAGAGRYVLETVKCFQDRDIDVTLRDFSAKNLEDAKKLANGLQLKMPVTYQCRDAFSSDSYPESEEKYDIVIISGLFELFSENALISKALQGVLQQLKVNGYVIYTNQPWHPQLLMIAKTLTNHQGSPWIMRPRPQAEMDALIAEIGGQKIETKIGIAGIFTVSVTKFGYVAAELGVSD